MFGAETKTTPLPINATFHAFEAPKPDVVQIVRNTTALSYLALTRNVFLSSEDGTVFPAQDGTSLLREAVLNMLHRMTDNQKVIAALTTLLGQKDAIIIPVIANKGATRLTQAFEKDTKSHRAGIKTIQY